MRQEYYIILELINSGYSPEEAAELIGLAPHDVKAVLEVLREKGLVEVKKGFFGDKYVLTEKGRAQLEQWRNEVRGQLELAAGRSGREAGAEIVERWLPILPVLVGLGLVSLALWKLLTSRSASADG